MPEKTIAADVQVYSADLVLSREDTTWQAAIAVATSDESLDAEAYLHPNELRMLRGMKFDRRSQTYLLGRIAAKRAILHCTSGDHPTQIEVRAGVFGQPVCEFAAYLGYEVSISHTQNVALAIAFPAGHQLAIDFELCSRTNEIVMKSQTTEVERNSIHLLPLEQPISYAVLWTAKEALAKVLKCGFTVPPHILAVETATMIDGATVSRFKNFSQYKSVSWVTGNFAVSVVAPDKTDLSIDPSRLQKWLCHTDVCKRTASRC